MLRNMLGGNHWRKLVLYKFNRVDISKSVYRLWKYHYMCETKVA